MNTATIVIFIAKFKYFADRTLKYLLLFKILLMSITLEVKVDMPLNKKLNKLLKSCNDSNSSQVEILKINAPLPISAKNIFSFCFGFLKSKRKILEKLSEFHWELKKKKNSKSIDSY